jgi:hypothetical protein
MVGIRGFPFLRKMPRNEWGTEHVWRIQPRVPSYRKLRKELGGFLARMISG